jgi:hypothetical protein
MRKCPGYCGDWRPLDSYNHLSKFK